MKPAGACRRRNSKKRTTNCWPARSQPGPISGSCSESRLRSRGAVTRRLCGVAGRDPQAAGRGGAAGGEVSRGAGAISAGVRPGVRARARRLLDLGRDTSHVCGPSDHGGCLGSGGRGRVTLKLGRAFARLNRPGGLFYRMTVAWATPRERSSPTSSA